MKLAARVALQIDKGHAYFRVQRDGPRIGGGRRRPGTYIHLGRRPIVPPELAERFDIHNPWAWAANLPLEDLDRIAAKVAARRARRRRADA